MKHYYKIGSFNQNRSHTQQFSSPGILIPVPIRTPPPRIKVCHRLLLIGAAWDHIEDPQEPVEEGSWHWNEDNVQLPVEHSYIPGWKELMRITARIILSINILVWKFVFYIITFKFWMCQQHKVVSVREMEQNHVPYQVPTACFWSFCYEPGSRVFRAQLLFIASFLSIFKCSLFFCASWPFWFSSFFLFSYLLADFIC